MSVIGKPTASGSGELTIFARARGEESPASGAPGQLCPGAQSAAGAESVFHEPRGVGAWSGAMAALRGHQRGGRGAVSGPDKFSSMARPRLLSLQREGSHSLLGTSQRLSGVFSSCRMRSSANWRSASSQNSLSFPSGLPACSQSLCARSRMACRSSRISTSPMSTAPPLRCSAEVRAVQASACRATWPADSIYLARYSFLLWRLQSRRREPLH
jgi:hypothetical protein